MGTNTISLMNDFSVTLIEQHQANLFTLNSLGKRDFTIQERQGLLKRQGQKNWFSQAQSFHSLSAIKEDLPENLISLLNRRKVKYPQITDWEKNISEYDLLIDFLSQLTVFDWKISFRHLANTRYICNHNHKSCLNHFNYRSVLVKIKMTPDSSEIEIGEGISTTDPYKKFNQNGLCQRITNIIDNQKMKKSLVFPSPVPIVFSSGNGAIIFHEILGHSLEADWIYRRVSPFSLDDLGKRITSDNINVTTDDGQDQFFNQIERDDEGEKWRSAVVVEKGILRQFISDHFYHQLLRIPFCGYARLEDYTCIPQPRMFALYLLPGKYHPQELIESTSLGVYAKEFGEGKVLFDNNLFHFQIKEAYLIEKGKTTFPLGSITVWGNINQALNSVEMVADDFRYDSGTSYCFKNNQMLNVRVGQPTVKINNLWVS